MKTATVKSVYFIFIVTYIFHIYFDWFVPVIC